MNKIIFDDLRSFNKSATDSSLKSYTSSILKICSDLVHKNECSPPLFKDPKVIFKLIENQKLTTQKNKLVSVLVYLQSKGYNKDIIEMYNDKIYSLLGKIRIQTEKNEYTDKERDNLLTMDEIVLLGVRLKKELPSVLIKFNDFNSYMKYLIIELASRYPLRNDWVDMKMIEPNDKSIFNKNFNYMIIDKDVIKFKIFKYKTVKSHGEIDFETKDKDLINIILKYYKNAKEYYEENDKDFEGWFLFKRNFEPLSRNLFTHWLQNLFYSETQKKLSSSMLRKITTSNLLDIKKFKELSRIQGHTIAEALTTYTKH
jgi:hypothetical protein